MKPFGIVEGVAAPILRINVNTDVIIPGSYLKSQSADLAKGMFSAWRYHEDGSERADFILNRDPFRSSRIILAGENFGCGSSREAAVWALKRFGIRAVFAPSFADIFYENAFRNGVLPGIVDMASLKEMEALALEGQPEFTIDLEHALIRHGNKSWRFEVPQSRQQALLRGDDEITMTLALKDEIARFHTTDRAERSWAYAPLPDRQSPPVASGG